MPRTFKRPSERLPDMFDPEWRAYFKERREHLDIILGAQEELPIGWIVRDLLPGGYLALLAGRPKDGKTCFAAALAAAVSRGDVFAGMETTQNHVLYLAAEESASEWRWAIRDNLPELDPEQFSVAHTPFAIDDFTDLSALRERVTRKGIGLIVVDPLLAATSFGDFANPRRARNALMGLKLICQERNCSAIVVHHAKERRDRAHRVAENPQLAATASLNIVLNWRKHPQGRLITLNMTGRGAFANKTLKLLSESPCRFSPLTQRSADAPSADGPRTPGPQTP